MRVLFLDFDGVLNSEASFRMEVRKGNEHVSDSLSEVACSNLQYVLEKVPDLRIVISSTWRLLHDMAFLRKLLTSYNVDADRVIGKTPATMSRHRGREIGLWLEDSDPIDSLVIIDDDGDARAVITSERVETDGIKALFVQTEPDDGLTLQQAKQIVAFLQM